ncbi:MAG: lysyl oxidase family protein [Nitrospiria bacterium]
MRLSLVLIAVLALAIPAVVGTTSANHQPQIKCLVPGGIICPDLWVDGNRFNAFLQTRTFSSSSCDVVEGMSQAGTRQLLRFTFTTPNKGLADLIVGPPSGNPNFVYSSCHGHYHFKQYADYRLWTPTQYATYDALRIANPGVQAHEIIEDNPNLQPIRGDKRGFCVIDLVQYGIGVPRWQSCSNQGISINWADEYYWSLSGQYVDVTGVPSGTYVLEAEVNSEQLYEETNYDNNRASRTVVI